MRRVDPFLLALVFAVVLASVTPLPVAAAPAASAAVKVAVFGLFFMYGARLSPSQAWAGLRHWRLHTLILSFTYVLFPLLGLAAAALATPWLSDGLLRGVLWLAIVPSTVQAAITFVSISRGNVAGAVVSASASNLLGVVLTPALAAVLLARSSAAPVGASGILALAAQLALPFVLGQLARRWRWSQVLRDKRLSRIADKSLIVGVVYVAFSQGVQAHVWERASGWHLLTLVVVCVLMLAAALAATWWIPRLAGLPVPDVVAAQFCGTTKSLATGLPMASVLFAGDDVALMVLPLMVYHQLQLVVGAWLARRHAARMPVSRPGV